MNYSRLPAFVLGFHGCDRAVAEQVVSKPMTHLLPSQNEYDWLGHGIYFWENNQSGNLLRALDCAVINFLQTIVVERNEQPFDSVRAAFLEGDPVYPTAGFRQKNHIQICVRNTANIRGYFYPIE